MHSFRLLDPFNQTDQKHFESILDHYLEFENNRKIKLYDYQSIVKMVEWFKLAFDKFSQKDFVVCSKFENGELVKIIIAYKLKIRMHDNSYLISDNILPYSYLSLVYHKHKTWGSPEEDMGILSTMASEHFEAQGLTKMLLTVRLSKKILRAVDIEDFLNQEFTKTFPNSGKKYHLTLEAVFFNQTDLDNYKTSLFRCLVPLNIYKPVMIIGWNLKSKYVLNNWIKNNDTD
jgi:hypothetical protein